MESYEIVGTDWWFAIDSRSSDNLIYGRAGRKEGGREFYFTAIDGKVEWPTAVPPVVTRAVKNFALRAKTKQPKPTPAYRKPTDKEIEEALEEAAYSLGRYYEFKRLTSVSPKRVPMDIQFVELYPKMVEAFRRSPQSLPPIIIRRDFTDDPWQIIDGRHRVLAAREASIRKIWAVEVE